MHAHTHMHARTRTHKHTHSGMLAGGWIGDKQDTDKCGVNAIHILLFVINHTILLPAKKYLSVNMTRLYYLKCCKHLRYSLWMCLSLIPDLLSPSPQLLAWRRLLKIDWGLSTQVHSQTFFLMHSHTRTKFSLVATEAPRPVSDWCAVARVVFGWHEDCRGFWQCSLQISCSERSWSE